MSGNSDSQSNRVSEEVEDSQDTEIRAPLTKWLQYLREFTNCGPISAYMLGKITSEEFARLNQQVRSTFGIAPSKLLNVINNSEKSHGEKYEWVKIKPDESGKNLITYFKSILSQPKINRKRKRLSESESKPIDDYKTLILGIKLDANGHYKTGHYSVVTFNNKYDVIMIADPHEEYTWTDVFPKYSFSKFLQQLQNPAVKYRDATSFIETHNVILVLKNNKYELPSGDIATIFSQQQEKAFTPQDPVSASASGTASAYAQGGTKKRGRNRRKNRTKNRRKNRTKNRTKKPPHKRSKK